MSYIGHCEQLNIFAGLFLAFGVGLADFVRNVIVGGAVDHDLFCFDAQFGRRGFAVVIWDFSWRAAKKTGDSVVAEVQFPTAMKIEHAGQRKALLDCRFVCSKTESELAPGRVSGSTEAGEIKLRLSVLLVIILQQAVCSADVFKGPRPSATWIANAAVFDVPCGNAGRFQCLAEMAGVSEIVFSTPVAAVNQEYNWVPAFARGKAHINELIGVLTIVQAKIGFGWFCGENVVALHGIEV